MKCPNLSNPNVKKGFNQMEKTFGSTVAYKLYNDNNGNLITDDRNGNPSTLLKQLTKFTDVDTAIKLKANTFNTSFLMRYGNWLTTDLPEPILDENNVFNGDNIVVPYIYTGKALPRTSPIQLNRSFIHINGKYGIKLASKLQDTFSKYGVKVNVTIDDTLTESGNVESVNGIIEIKINPNKLYKDTVFHEFAHIIIDMINDKDYVNFAINELRDTKLWRQVKSVTAEVLTDEQFGKEVLATAIGIEAANIFDEQEQVKKWRFILNNIISRIAKFLGIKETVAKTLARDLVAGEINQVLDYYAKVEKQFQHYNQINDTLLPLRELLMNTNNSLNGYISEMHRSIAVQQYKTSAQTAKTLITDYTLAAEFKGVFDMSLAIDGITKFVTSNVESVQNTQENLMQTYGTGLFTFDTVSPEAFQIVSDTLFQNNRLLTIFENIQDVDVKKLKTAVNITRTKLENGGTIKGVKISDLQYLDNVLFELNNTLYGAEPLKDILDDMKAKQQYLEDLFVGYIISMTTDNALHQRQSKYNANQFSNIYIEAYHKELIDESEFSSWFDSSYDSRNKFVSNATKYMVLYYGKRDLEVQRLQRQFFNAYNKGTVKSRQNEIIEKGRLIQEYDYKTFYTAVHTIYQINKAADKKATFKQAVNSLSDIVSPEIQDAAMAKKKEDLENNIITQFEYERWLSDNFIITTESTEPRLGGEFAKPRAEYKNKKYLDLVNANDELTAFYFELKNMLKYLTEHIEYSPQYNGALPAISTIEQKNEMLKYEEEKNIALNINGEQIWHIPFPYLGLLNSEEKYKIPVRPSGITDEQYDNMVIQSVNSRYNTTFTKKSEIYDANKAISIKNKELHAKDLNTDLGFTIPLFIESALNNKYKAKIKSTVTLALEKLRDAEIHKVTRTGLGAVIYNKFDLNGKNLNATVSGVESNAYKQFEARIKMDFYEKFTKDSPEKKIVNTLKNYTSLLGIGFNVYSAAKNVAYGTISTAIEGGGALYYNKHEIAAAMKAYIKDTPSFIHDLNMDDKYSSSFTSGLISMFQVIENYSELLEKGNPAIHNNKFKKWFNKSAYGMTTMGEHFMHNVAMLAMLNSHRLVDGKIKTLSDLLNSELNIINPLDTKERNKEKIANNKIKEEEIRNKFESYPKVIDLLEFKQDAITQRGFVDFKRDDEGNQLISDNEFIFFKERIKGVNQSVHGIYNKIDKGRIEHYPMGQLLMQYRHWMRAGWTKRMGAYGTLLKTNEYWNERRQNVDIGDYKVVVKMIRNAYATKNVDFSNIKDLHVVWGSVQQIFSGLYELATNFMYYYNILTPTEKAGAKRTMYELLSVGLLTLAVFTVLKADDDDDEDGFHNNMVYFLSGLRSELITFVPGSGWYNTAMNMKENPMAALGTLAKIAKASISVLAYPTQSDKERRYRSGYRKGHLKVVEDIITITPIANRSTTIRRLLFENEGEYKTFLH